MRSVFLAVGLMGALIVGCSGAPDEAGQDVDSEGTTEMLRAGRVVPQRELVALLREAGFPDDELGRMVCTAKWESSFYERAYNKNRSGSIDRGLFQINDIHLGFGGCPRSGEALYDARTNTKCAYAVWKLQGNRAWYGYLKHRAECDSFRVDE